MRYVGIALSLGLLSLSALAQAAEPGQQQAESVELTFQVPYLLHLPKSYGTDTEKKWPLIVFLHGSGEKGTDLNLVKLHGPPKIVEKDPEFPFVVVSPQCPVGQRWTPLLLSGMLDNVVAKYGVDQDRIYLTGLSMGGFGAWEWAAIQPHRFAALVPICGRGDPQTAKKIKHIPTWVFHGAKDMGAPVSDSEDMVRALEKLGGTPKYTLYPEAGHDAWTETYNNPELYKWLLEQKRPAAEAKK
ncbi:MAG: dienelactone hydrolase family protein [Planctomycetota bacterium]